MKYEGDCFGHYGEKGICKMTTHFCEDDSQCFVYTKKLRGSVTKASDT